MANILFLCKCARQDIQSYVTFLTARVKEPDEDNWKKLKRAVLYINGTVNLIITLSAGRLNFAKWWVDGSYATQPNMRGHIGQHNATHSVDYLLFIVPRIPHQQGTNSPGQHVCHVVGKNDKIESGEVEVKHCGAQEMAVDYFTMLLQGHLFCKFCKAILDLEDE
eukprot:5033521-Ditylum_brightwellii.AAC.1